MVAIVNYGVGNLFSLVCSFREIGEPAVVTADPSEIRRADRILLPGVGAFADAIAKLRKTGLDQTLFEEAEKGKPFLGICLGMQLLFEKSFEYGEHRGLGWLPGEVRYLEGSEKSGMKVPHMGWNALHFSRDAPLFRGIPEGSCVYFVHSYQAENCPFVVATAEYGVPVTAAVRKDNIYGCQFHPEKSGRVGLEMLRNFTQI